MLRVVLALSIGVAAAGCDSPAADGATAATRTRKLDAGAPEPDAAVPKETRSRRRQGTRVADMRALAADIAADRVCRSLRNRFHRLKATRRPDMAIGVLWVERCRATARGEQISIAISGQGWRWVQREREKAGADFAVTDYGRFAFQVDARADIDVAYASANHVVTAWAELIDRPTLHIEPLGEIDVDAESVWGDIVGNAGALVGDSPEDVATEAFVARARKQAVDQLRQGMTVSIDLCSGDVDTEVGQLRAGRMLTPVREESVGPRHRAGLYERGLLLVGPVKIRRGTRLDIHVIAGGPVRAAIVCEPQAAQLARAFAHGEPLPTVQVVAERTISGTGTVQVARPPCQRAAVALIGTTDRPTEVEYGLTRLASEREPYLDCKRQ